MAFYARIYHWRMVNKWALSNKALSRFHTFISVKQQVIGSLLISTLQSIFGLSFLLIGCLSWMKLDFFALKLTFLGVFKKNTHKKDIIKIAWSENI
jgi:hypothetical protein